MRKAGRRDRGLSLHLDLSSPPYALRITHYAVERGTPARGGYPLHSPLSYYSTHRSLPECGMVLHSGRLPTHDPTSCPTPLGTPTVYRLPSTVRAGAMAMARDHGSIALNARYARPKGVPLPTVYLRTVPYIRPFSIPKKENSTQNLELKTHNS